MKARGKQVGPRSVYKQILKTDVSACGLDITLASVEDGVPTPSYRRLGIGKRLASDFRDIAHRVFRARGRDVENGNAVIHDYNPESKLDRHEVEHLTLPDHDTVAMQLTPLVDLVRLDEFDHKDTDFVEGLRFYVITLRPKQGQPIHLFRVCTPKMELSRSTKLAVLFRDGHYDRYRENLFLFDRGVDCVAQGDHLFIFGKGNFHQMFRYSDLILKAAEETLRVIKKRVPIAGFAEFRQDCMNHLKKLQKLKNVASKEYIARITIADMKQVIKQHNLPIATKGKGKNEKLVYDGEDKWAILKLLDDDYLSSVMTEEKYEVNSKRAM